MRITAYVLAASITLTAPAAAQERLSGGGSAVSLSIGRLGIDAWRGWAAGVHYDRFGRGALGAEFSLVGTGGAGGALLIPSFGVTLGTSAGASRIALSGGFSSAVFIGAGVGAVVGPQIGIAWTGPFTGGPKLRVGASAHWYRLERNDRLPMFYVSLGFGWGSDR